MMMELCSDEGLEDNSLAKLDDIAECAPARLIGHNGQRVQLNKH